MEIEGKWLLRPVIAIHLPHFDSDYRVQYYFMSEGQTGSGGKMETIPITRARKANVINIRINKMKPP